MSNIRVMVAHSYYQQQGGEDRSFEGEVRLLQQAGIEVVSYARSNDELSTMSAWTAARKTIWNAEVARHFGDVWARSGPFDVVHFQNTFPLLSPSVLWFARRKGAAVVQSLRNYRGMCVNGLLYRNGSICEKCVRWPVALPGVLHRCYRDSMAASAVVATSNAVSRAMGTRERAVDRFVAMSSFTRKKYIEAGYDGERIAVKPNFLTPDPGLGPGDGAYALFVGRLAPGKGIETLLRAWQMLGPRLPLWIVGSGPLEPMVRRATDDANVHLLGQRSASDVLDLMGRARVLVFPSESYETFGRVAIEAFAKGTPVVASGVGGVAEIVEDGRTGAMFRPGDAHDLVAQVMRVIEDEHPAAMRAAARRMFEERFTAERNLDATLQLYHEAMAAAQRRVTGTSDVQHGVRR